mmetsp:Transcript_1785/g.5823  ORF Transcript_1785/g.5823 Transcript_1785/m.5823 type:complete len:221 (-) Transcript_1785:2-664(-)
MHALKLTRQTLEADSSLRSSILCGEPSTPSVPLGGPGRFCRHAHARLPPRARVARVQRRVARAGRNERKRPARSAAHILHVHLALVHALRRLAPRLGARAARLAPKRKAAHAARPELRAAERRALARAVRTRPRRRRIGDERVGVGSERDSRAEHGAVPNTAPLGPARRVVRARPRRVIRREWVGVRMDRRRAAVEPAAARREAEAVARARAHAARRVGR